MHLTPSLRKPEFGVCSDFQFAQERLESIAGVGGGWLCHLLILEPSSQSALLWAMGRDQTRQLDGVASLGVRGPGRINDAGSSWSTWHPVEQHLLPDTFKDVRSAESEVRSQQSMQPPGYPGPGDLQLIRHQILVLLGPCSSRAPRSSWGPCSSRGPHLSWGSHSSWPPSSPGDPAPPWEPCSSWRSRSSRRPCSSWGPCSSRGPCLSWEPHLSWGPHSSWDPCSS